MDASGDVIVTGSFFGTVNFGGGNLTSMGSADIFLVKYRDEEPVPVFISYFDATPRGIAVDVTWDFLSDEPLGRFTLYRRHGALPSVVIASGNAETTRSYTDTAVESGETYHYTLVIHTAGGDEYQSRVATVTVDRLAVALSQNFPNPFNPSTAIHFSLEKRQRVTITVYDTRGRLIRTLLDDVRSAGPNTVSWDGTDDHGAMVSTGVYFYQMTAEKFEKSMRMVLLK